MSTIEIIPTCVPVSSADLEKKGADIRTLATAIHIDITDGIFAPACTWPYSSKGSFKSFDLNTVRDLQIEMHLMVQNPRAIGIQFARAGAFRILGHVEAFENTEAAHGALDAWKIEGAREVGLGLLMQTPFETLDPLLPACDVAHMMSIGTIGTQGIAYESSAPERIRLFHERNPEMLISVDGGVAETNIADLARAGARRFGVGSALSKAGDPKKMYDRLLQLAQNAAV